MDRTDVAGTDSTGEDIEVETTEDSTGVDDGTGDGTGVDIIETGVDGGDGSGVDSGVETGEAGTDVGTEGSRDVLEEQFRATCLGCLHLRHRPEYQHSRGG